MRLASLDVLRCIAVLLVLGRHAPVNGTISQIWFNGGWLGVDLFFVLSGFLVSGLIFREYKETGKVDITRFLIRRGFKIYPSFWVFLIVSIMLFWNEITYRQILGEVLFLQNYVGLISVHTWSLAVEEHFYFGLALAVFMLLRYARSFQNIPTLFVIAAASCFALRALMATYKGVNAFPTHFRIDALFFGVLISYCWHFHHWDKSRRLKKYRYHIGIFGALLLVPFFIADIANTPEVFVFGLSITYIAGGLILLSFLQFDMGRLQILSKIGMYSYSIYLWHLVIMRVLLRYELSWWATMALYLTGSIGIGIMMSKLIEYPALKLRDRMFSFGYLKSAPQKL